MRACSFPLALRRAALLATLSALICAAGVRLEQIALDEQRRIEATEKAARDQLVAAREAEIALATYGARYEALRRRGVIGESQRLAFVETLEAVTQELRLRTVTWELAPATVTGTLSVARMKLQVGLVHEGQLLRLLERLRARAPAAVWTRRCTLDRKGSEVATPRRDEVNLTAECELEWRTVRTYG